MSAHVKETTEANLWEIAFPALPSETERNYSDGDRQGPPTNGFQTSEAFLRNALSKRPYGQPSPVVAAKRVWTLAL